MTGPATGSTARPTKPKPKPTVVLGIIVAIIFTVFSARQVNMRLSTFVDMWTNPLWEKFWPIEWSWVFDRTHVFNPLIETFQIGIISAVVGCTLALPISFAMSRLTTPNRVVYYLTKAVMNVIRAVPDLFWAKLLVTAVGIGAFAGSWALSIFSLAVMVKLFSEDVDGADPRPLEAAKAAGGRHLPSVATGVFPTVFPAYVAYSLYVLELNIRASLVLGLVGAGGIGRVIEAQRQVFQFDRILGILVIIFVVVFVLEQISVALRKRLV